MKTFSDEVRCVDGQMICFKTKDNIGVSSTTFHSSTMAELDQQTESLVQQLYDAWSNNADASSYLNLRDQLLSRRERVDTCITTLKTVISVTCPEINETERFFDPRWEELFALAETVESSDGEDSNNLGKRKRGYNEVHRLRNLAIVSALWSPDVVRHYEWNNAAQGSLQLLKSCALRFPNFGNQFCPHLNRVLLDRHCEAIVSGHLKTLGEAPLQCHRDLNIVIKARIVPSLETEELWVNDFDGAVPVHPDGRLLKDVRPCHVQQYLLCRDQFGMLVPRPERQDSLISNQEFDFSLAPAIYEEFLAHDDIFDAAASGLTVSPTDMFTPFEIGPFNSLMSSVQGGTPCSGPNDVSTNTSVSGDALDLATNPDKAPALENAGVREQAHAEATDNDQIDDQARRNHATLWQETGIASIARRTEAALRRPATSKSSARNGAPNARLLSRPGLSKSTMEDELHSRHDQMLSAYGRHIEEAAMRGSNQRRKRANWLGPRWARIWSNPESESLSPGTAASVTDCDVVYCSADGMLDAARAGEIFSKPVVIKESFSDADMHEYEHFISLLYDASNSDEQVEVGCMDMKQTVHQTLGEFTAYTRLRPELSDGLWMSTARSVAKCHRPLFTMLNRFRLLESLSEGLHDCQSTSTSPSRSRPMSASFNTISSPGAFVGPYLESSAGSWQRNLSGTKYWVFVPATEVSSDELTDLANRRDEWVPLEKQRLVVLEKNDVLFIPPGLRLVQAWHTPTPCLTEQGMLWDDLSILSIVRTVNWGREHQAGQLNHHPQLLGAINALHRLIQGQPDRFRGSMTQDEFLSHFRESLLVSC